MWWAFAQTGPARRRGGRFRVPEPVEDRHQRKPSTPRRWCAGADPGVAAPLAEGLQPVRPHNLPRYNVLPHLRRLVVTVQLSGLGAARSGGRHTLPADRPLERGNACPFPGGLICARRGRIDAGDGFAEDVERSWPTPPEYNQAGGAVLRDNARRRFRKLNRQLSSQTRPLTPDQGLDTKRATA